MCIKYIVSVDVWHKARAYGAMPNEKKNADSKEHFLRKNDIQLKTDKTGEWEAGFNVSTLFVKCVRQ